MNAHKINRGEHVTLDNKSRDFFFLKRDDANVIISVVLTLIQKKLPKYVHATQTDIQVLTPMRKGLLGVERLNEILQHYLNPPDPKSGKRGVRFFQIPGGRQGHAGEKTIIRSTGRPGEPTESPSTKVRVFLTGYGDYPRDQYLCRTDDDRV